MTNDRQAAVRFELSAYHPERSPAEVSERLALTPYMVLRAGDPSSVPELGPIPDNGWFYIGWHDNSHEAGTLWWLLSYLAQRREHLAFLLNVGWDVDVVLDLLPDDSMPTVTHELKQACNELGLALSVLPVHGLIGNL
jgi:hypothetical protein